MKNLSFILLLSLFVFACTATEEKADTETASEPAAVEEARPIDVIDGDNYIEMAKAGLQGMVDQNVDAFTANFADDAVYVFNSGDSLAGIDVIKAYWAERMEVIESISFGGEIYMAVDVQEGAGPEPGHWLLAWFNVDATYTSGGNMNQFIHTVYHFNDAGKIDRVIQYLDRASIMEAQGG